MTPSWDLRTLWVDSDKGNTLTPIDPQTGRAGKPRPVADPYNLYFTPDGHARSSSRSAFSGSTSSIRTRCASSTRRRCRARASTTWTSRPTGAGRWRRASSRASSRCSTSSASGSAGYVQLHGSAMPQDVRLSPRRSLVLHRRHGQRRRLAGQRAHDASGRVPQDRRRRARLRPSAATRSGCSSPTAARGRSRVLDLATNRLVARLAHPRRRQPGHGRRLRRAATCCGCRAAGNSEVYAISHPHRPACCARIPVGPGPPGSRVWPQPGRYSLGHTGTLR